MDLDDLTREEAEILKKKHQREGIKAEVFKETTRLFMLELKI